MSKDPLLLVNIENLPPEGLERKGEVTAADLELPDDERFAVQKHVHLDVFVSRVKKGVLCQGRTWTLLSCRCDRCLAGYTYKISISGLCHLYEDLTEDVLDLTYAIREDILLAVPQHTVCKDSCRGLCSQCGADLNEIECDCCQPQEEETSVWSVLDGLHLSK